MKFISVEKVHQGAFISRYDMTYETIDNHKKVYEMISRDNNIGSIEDVVNKDTDAVVIIAHDETGEKVLLNKEFRMAVGRFVYNFPAGLIDDGEDFATSAARELKEETGLNLISIDDVMHESYSAVGFSNETNICVVVTAGGKFAPSDSTVEEIEAGWYTKEEVRELLKGSHFAARTQAYCYLWSKI
ncbi:MAG: NUDIX hydrolase [Lachnospiraceae bacterium]|nr:NUDIX hydrolase [Lachnospiraceae bacterium]